MAKSKRVSVEEYFRLPESLNPMELVHGFVREPPAPRYGHQSIVTRLTAMLDAHVRAHQAGRVCVSPVDVVLDRSTGLVVQPDIVFVAASRLHIIDERIWGAPDLAIEVLSPRTAERDRTTKLAWYRRYGVAEAWLVDVGTRAVTIVSLAPPETRAVFSGDMPMSSTTLPHWTMTTSDIFTP